MSGFAVLSPTGLSKKEKIDPDTDSDPDPEIAANRGRYRYRFRKDVHGTHRVGEKLLGLMPRPFGAAEEIVADFFLQRFDLQKGLFEHGFIHVSDFVQDDAVVHGPAVME